MRLDTLLNAEGRELFQASEITMIACLQANLDVVKDNCKVRLWGSKKVISVEDYLNPEVSLDRAHAAPAESRPGNEERLHP